jgi:hypothetical protein
MVSGSCWPAYTISSAEVLSPVATSLCPRMDREHQRADAARPPRSQATPLPRPTAAVSVVRSCASATTTPSLLWSLPGLAGSARPPWPERWTGVPTSCGAHRRASRPPLAAMEHTARTGTQVPGAVRPGPPAPTGRSGGSAGSASARRMAGAAWVVASTRDQRAVCDRPLFQRPAGATGSGQPAPLGVQAHQGVGHWGPPRHMCARGASRPVFTPAFSSAYLWL